MMLTEIDKYGNLSYLIFIVSDFKSKLLYFKVKVNFLLEEILNTFILDIDIYIDLDLAKKFNVSFIKDKYLSYKLLQ